MSQGTKLAPIPAQAYSDYRYNVIFKAYKWDPQFGDRNTVSKHVVLLDATTAAQLRHWTEQLAQETVCIERALLQNLALTRELGLPKAVRKGLDRAAGYDCTRHVRLMRFDFHPTADGWKISEVNSDVPGGFAEASVLPDVARVYFPGYESAERLSDALLDAFEEKIGGAASVAFVHATSYSDDRQVMQFLADTFHRRGMDTFFAAPDHLRWVDGNAISILQGHACAVGGIVRFFPLEWLDGLPRSTDWGGYYRCKTTSCNHPVAILTQSKRLPLVWDGLGADIPAWRTLLPETQDPRAIDSRAQGWIFKPTLGRVGEGISIPGTISSKEHQAIEKAVRRNPRGWVAQRKFDSVPLRGEDGADYHLCIGAFAVEGKFAGFYGRISTRPRIDSQAEDIPVLIQKGDGTR